MSARRSKWLTAVWRVLTWIRSDRARVAEPAPTDSAALRKLHIRWTDSLRSVFRVGWLRLSKSDRV